MRIYSGFEITLVILILTIAALTEALQDIDKPFLTAKSEITLLTANDAGVAETRTRSQDSFTVIRLGPNDPPVSTTIYGTVPHTILSIPKLAITDDGRYGFVMNNTFRFSRTALGDEVLEEPERVESNFVMGYKYMPVMLHPV